MNESNNKSLLIYKPVPEWIEYAKTLPDPEKLFDSFWFEGELCFLFSDMGVGKTALSVQIAQSIATGQPISELIKMGAKSQRVFLCEFELSVKQFESRFKDKETGIVFTPSEHIIRAELNLQEFDFRNSLEETVIEDIKNALKETEIKVVIIDNITAIQDTGRIDQAIRFMQKMNKIKRELGLSILILGHTPKRNLTEPITQNNMGGSKKLMDLADSSFCISKSTKGERYRYIKQIKVRQDAFRYNSENVIDCELAMKSGFLSFQINGTSPELSHLKKPNPKENRNDEIIEAYFSNKYTQVQIAEKFEITDRQVRNIIENYKKELQSDSLPF